jgi:hypothetical protein
MKTVLWSTAPNGHGPTPNSLRFSIVASPCPSLANGNPSGSEAHILKDWRNWTEEVFSGKGRSKKLRLKFYLQFKTKNSSQLVETSFDDAKCYPNPDFLPSDQIWAQLFPVEHSSVQLAAGPVLFAQAATPGLPPVSIPPPANQKRPRQFFTDTTMSYSVSDATAHVVSGLASNAAKAITNEVISQLGSEKETLPLIRMAERRQVRATSAGPAPAPPATPPVNRVKSWILPAPASQPLASTMRDWIAKEWSGANGVYARRLERNVYRLSSEPWTSIEDWALAEIWSKTMDSPKAPKDSVLGKPFADATSKRNQIFSSFTATKTALDVAVFFGRVRRAAGESRKASRTDTAPKYSKSLAANAGDAPPTPPPFAQKILMLNNYPLLMRKVGLIFDLIAVLPANLGEAQVRTCVVRDDSDEFGWSPWTKMTGEFRAALDGADSIKDQIHLEGRLRTDVISASAVDTGATMLKIINQAHTSNSADHDDPPVAVSHGISIYLNDRANIVRDKIQERQTGFNAEASNGQSPGQPMPFLLSGLNKQITLTIPTITQYFSDLVRGYVPFVKTMPEQNFRPLCARTESFTIGKEDQAKIWKPEGQWQSGKKGDGLQPFGCITASTTTTHDATSDEADNDAPDLHTHEAILTWQGWSPVAPSPLDEKRKHQTEPNSDPDQSDKPLLFDGEFGPAVKAEFNALGLPVLQFGKSYEFSIPCMDIAGNFQPPTDRTTLSYHFLRFDPVMPPELLLMHHLSGKSLGEQLTHLVIRSASSESADTCVRVIVPPRCSLALANKCGMFESRTPHSTGSFDHVCLLHRRAQFHVDVPDDPESKTRNPIYRSPQVFFDPCQYLPDPYAEGFKMIIKDPAQSGFRRETEIFPFYSDRAWPHADLWTVALRPQKVGVSDITHEVESHFHLGPFGKNFKTVTIRIPEGCQVTVDMVSVISKANQSKMAVVALTAAGLSTADTEVQAAARAALADKSASVLTPALEFSAVHAVPAPVIIPRNLLVQPANRNVGDTAQIHTSVSAEIHLPSTGKLTIRANWEDWIDQGPGTPSPKAIKKSAIVFESTTPQSGAVDITEQGIHVTRVNLPFPPEKPGDPAAKPVTHELGDTRSRQVDYVMEGKARLLDYFRSAGDTTEESNLSSVTVLSTGANPAPLISYITPTFRWLNILPDRSSSEYSQRKHRNDGGAFGRQRCGGGLRIWLERPWYVTGTNEKLGILVWKDAATAASDSSTEAFPTRWGSDPIWDSHTTNRGPTPGDFYSAAVTKHPTNANYSIMTFDPHYDLASDKWHVDLRLKNITSYCPFIQFSLIRFQADALDSCKVSPVAFGPPLQLLPDRKVFWDLQMSELMVTLADSVQPARVSQRATFQLIVERLWNPGQLRKVWDTTDTLPGSIVTGGAASAGKLCTWKVPFKRDDHGSVRISVQEFETFEGEQDYPPVSSPDGLIPKIESKPRLVFTESIVI